MVVHRTCMREWRSASKIRSKERKGTLIGQPKDTCSFGAFIFLFVASFVDFRQFAILEAGLELTPC